MKILIINDFYEKGGAEVQAKLEMDLLKKKGHQVLLITFDPAFETGWVNENKEAFNFQRKDGSLDKLLDKIRPNCKVKRVVKKLMRSFSPDAIRLENCIKETPAVFGVLKKWKGIPFVQTMHDFGYVCPLTGYCAKLPTWEECPGFFAIGERCTCRENGFVWKKLKTFEVRRYRKLVRRFGIRLLTPSKALEKKLNQNGFAATTVPNLYPLEEKGGVPPKKAGFIFVGNLTRQKGVIPLLKAFAALGPSYKLDVVGPVAPDIQNEVNEICTAKPNMVFHGKQSHEDTLQYLRQAKFLIVPSLWMENYPNAILESFAAGTPVLGSNRGGIAEMIGDESLTFDVLSLESMISCIKASESMDGSAYLAIVQRNKDYLLQHNDPEIYYQSIMEAINDAKPK